MKKLVTIDAAFFKPFLSKPMQLAFLHQPVTSTTTKTLCSASVYHDMILICSTEYAWELQILATTVCYKQKEVNLYNCIVIFTLF